MRATILTGGAPVRIVVLPGRVIVETERADGTALERPARGGRPPVARLRAAETVRALSTPGSGPPTRTDVIDAMAKAGVHRDAARKALSRALAAGLCRETAGRILLEGCQ